MRPDVIVLSRDRPDLFSSCLASLEGQDYSGFLVDNGSDELTAEVARQAGWTVITPGHNSSFAEGNNLAIAQGTGERVVLVNNDVCLHPGALGALMGHDESVVGCLVLNPDGTVNHAGGAVHKEWPIHIGRGSDPADWYCRPVPWVTFACVSLRRDALEEVGPLDEGYWYCYEDVDWCLRARRSGHEVLVCADAVVTHDECSTRRPSTTHRGHRRFWSQWTPAEVKELV